jgi:Mpv17 / PMP22 family
MALMEGRDARHIRARFNDIYQEALLTNWKVWPTAQVRQLIMFSHFGVVDARRDSLSISASRPYRIVSRSSKCAVFSGHSTYPFSTQRMCPFIPDVDQSRTDVI